MSLEKISYCVGSEISEITINGILGQSLNVRAVDIHPHGVVVASPADHTDSAGNPVKTDKYIPMCHIDSVDVIYTAKG